MFTAEVYDNILRNLSRDDLDAVQLVSRHSDRTVESIPADHMPRRVLHRLFVHAHDAYVIEREEGSNRIPINDKDILTTRMKFALVGRLAFAELMDEPAVRMDESLLNMLLLQKEAWKVGTYEMGFSLGCTFASAAVCKRFFNEVFLCQSLHVGHECELALEGSLMATDAVQCCRSFLFRSSDDYNLNVDDLVAWLHRDRDWLEPLELFLSARNVNVPPFLGALKELFATSNKPHHYAVHIHMPDNSGIQEEVFYNKNTSERLGIARGNYCGHMVVKRESFKNE